MLAPMELSFTLANVPGAAGKMKCDTFQYHGISSRGYDTPDRNISPTEKKAIINMGASESVNHHERVNIKNEVAMR